MTNTKIKLNLDSLKSRREWKRHKVKDGHNIFRILPPFGESSNGYPYRKWQIIWGLTDPSSGRMRPFASSLTSEKRCPVMEYVDQLKVRASEIEDAMKTSGASAEDINARLKDLRDLINNLMPKTVYIYNAADKAGEVGLLELKSTAHKKMKTVMNQYIQDYNQDPTSLNDAADDSGVWVDVTRSGVGYKTEYDVVKCQVKTKTNNGVVFVDDRSPLPEAVVENYDNLAYDLSAVYQNKSFDELYEVLQANMPGIIAMVPDADLSKPVGSATSTVKATPAAKPATKLATGRVTTKIDDGDDDDVLSGNVLSAPKASSAAIDDDFMSEMDELIR